MRPARKGPENGERMRGRYRGDAASMRPARKGPENPHINLSDLADVPASMRPARKGPENSRPGGRRAGRPFRFNEAGPQGAGKRMLEVSVGEKPVGLQ